MFSSFCLSILFLSFYLIHSIKSMLFPLHMLYVFALFAINITDITPSLYVLVFCLCVLSQFVRPSSLLAQINLITIFTHSWVPFQPFNIHHHVYITLRLRLLLQYLFIFIFMLILSVCCFASVYITLSFQLLLNTYY